MRLFGADDPMYAQLDWVSEQSDHQSFLLDAAQSVRPADLPPAVRESMLDEVNGGRRRYVLTSQLSVRRSRLRHLHPTHPGRESPSEAVLPQL